MQFIDLQAQQIRIKKDVDLAVAAVLNHGRYILGPEVEQLETLMAEYVGAEYCLTCANGTDALQVALMSLGVGNGDEVIIPNFTYIAPAETVKLLGANIVLVDIDPNSYNIDATKIESAISTKTKAIIGVSLFGQCADFNNINKIAEKHGIPVIEDAAQSFGASHHGKKSCNLTTIACTSFFPSKPLGCYGDGGALFTNNAELALKMRQIARHGQKERYHHVRVGVNSRMDTVQAAILLCKLKIFDDEVKLRQEVASRYDQFFSSSDNIFRPTLTEGNTSVWAQYTIRVKNRNRLSDELKKVGIPTAIHYPLTVDAQPAMNIEIKTPMLSHGIARTVISLPMHPYLEDFDIETISQKILELVS